MPNLFIASANSQTPHPCPLVAKKGSPCHFGLTVDRKMGCKYLIDEFFTHECIHEDDLIKFFNSALGWCACHGSLIVAGTALYYGILWTKFKSMSKCIWNEVLAGSKCLLGLTEEDLKNIFDSREKLVREQFANKS